MGDMVLKDFDDELQARGFDGFLQAQRYRYVQWAYRDVVRMSEWRAMISTSSNIDLTAGGSYQIDVATLTDFGSIASITTTYEGGYRLKALDERDFFDNFHSIDYTTGRNRGVATHYYLHENNIWILPPPSVAMRFVVTYYRKAELLDVGNPTTTKPDTAAELDPAILARALMYCHRRANQWDLALAEEGASDRMIQDFMTAQEFETLDDPGHFSYPDPAWTQVSIAWP